MDIIKIIGVGFIAVIIIVILKQYRPEFAIYVSIAAGVIILLMLTDKISAIIQLIQDIASKTSVNTKFLRILIKLQLILQQ